MRTQKKAFPPGRRILADEDTTRSQYEASGRDHAKTLRINNYIPILGPSEKLHETTNDMQRKLLISFKSYDR